MTATSPLASVRNTDKFYIGGEWVTPSSDSVLRVIDSATEETFLSVAEAQAADMDRAISAAREAFDHGPWPKLSYAERAEYLRAFAAGVSARADDVTEVFPRQSGVIKTFAAFDAPGAAARFELYAGYADTFAFEELATPTAGGEWGLLVREPVGVVGAIVPWNGPLFLATAKIAPALLAGCTVVLKLSPEAPAEGYILADIAAEIGLPAGVLNIVTADRPVSELLVKDPRVDKISFTGSPVAGRRIGSLCGERIARVTLELGGKSAAVILDDMDLQMAADALTFNITYFTGQACSALTRAIVTRDRQAELVDALASRFAAVKVGDPFDPEVQMGPLAMERQRDRVEGYIRTGIDEGARLITGGGRPKDLSKGYFVEPTLFADVDNASRIGQEEIFGPVLTVIPADNEEHAVQLANESTYGLNASVFSMDTDRALSFARRLRTGTVGHNNWRTDFGVAFGGYKQSGLGREGGIEGLKLFLETKFIVLEDVPSQYRS